MSNRILTAAWKVRGLKCNEKCVLTNLADRADNEGNCFPSHKLICGDCGVKDRTLRKILPALEKWGHITIKREVRRSIKGFSVFSYNVHPLTLAADAGVTPAIGACDSGGAVRPHRHWVAPTLANGAGSILTTKNPTNPKGNRSIPPLPSKLPELIAMLKRQISKTPDCDAETLNCLWAKLGEYETQLFGALVTKRTASPKPLASKPGVYLKSFTPSSELGKRFRSECELAMQGNR